MQKIYEWYYLVCVYGLNFVEAKIFRDIFNTTNIDLHVELIEMHTIFCLKMLDITMMTSGACKCYEYFLISSVLNNIVRNLMTRCSCAV
jgi:hypothetical protein